MVHRGHLNTAVKHMYSTVMADFNPAGNKFRPKADETNRILCLTKNKADR